jgi:C4-dicarboxylate-binding protein DctP
MKFVTTVALLAVVASSANAAQADTYRLTIASSHATSLPWVGPLTTRIVADSNSRLEAKGSPYRIDWTEAYGGALYGFSDTLEAVGLGITDLGWVGTLWEESSMPYQNITYYTPFTTDDPAVLLDIFNRLHDELPFLANSWDAQDQVFLGGSAADTYHLLTTFPIETIDDLSGRRILAPGPSGAWLAAVGAVPVSGALTTYYNQIETGIADGVLVILTGAYPLRLQEVAPHVTLVGLGANFIGGLSANRDTWERLPEDVRDVLRELGREYSSDNADQLAERYESILQSWKENPSVTVSALPESERLRWAEVLPDLAGSWAANLEHGEELLRAFVDAVVAAGETPLRNWAE